MFRVLKVENLTFCFIESFQSIDEVNITQSVRTLSARRQNTCIIVIYIFSIVLCCARWPFADPVCWAVVILSHSTSTWIWCETMCPQLYCLSHTYLIWLFVKSSIVYILCLQIFANSLLLQLNRFSSRYFPLQPLHFASIVMKTFYHTQIVCIVYIQWIKGRASLLMQIFKLEIFGLVRVQ